MLALGAQTEALSWGDGWTSGDGAPHPRPAQGLTSVVDVPEGRVDELAHVARALSDVQKHRDCVIAAVAQIQQGFGQAGLPRGWLCEERRAGEGRSARDPNCWAAGDRALGREPDVLAVSVLLSEPVPYLLPMVLRRSNKLRGAEVF